jgi:hypothetical protein
MMLLNNRYIYKVDEETNKFVNSRDVKCEGEVLFRASTTLSHTAMFKSILSTLLNKIFSVISDFINQFKFCINQMNLLVAIIIALFFLNLISLICLNRSISWNEPSNLNILNSVGNDFAPTYYKDNNQLIFNSDKDGKSYFYYSEINSSGNLGESKLFKSSVNKLSINQSYITFSNNGEAYFSKYQKYSRQSYLNIFKSIRLKNSWSDAIILDTISFDGFCSHPTISDDGNILIYTSNKENTEGNTDLWMSYRNDNGNWGTPFRLDELNSTGNEITPFLLNNDTLYFASDGFEGPGGFDIYISTRSGNKWNRPFPIEELNTEFNESDLIILPDNRAVFSSDRPGGNGKLDLYIASPKNDKIIETEKNAPEISIKTQVSNIIIQKNSSVQKFPCFHFLIKKIFENTKFSSNYVIDSLLIDYPNILAEYLRNNPSEILVLDSSSINQRLIGFFESNGIKSNRIKFQKTFEFSDFIKCRLLSGSSMPLIEVTDDSYICKPPVVEVSIDSREKLQIKSHNLKLITSINKHNFDIADHIIPFRDIITIDEYADEVYKSDSIIIDYEFTDLTNNKFNQNRVINVSRQQIKEQNKTIIDGKKYEEYYFIIPDKIFFNSDYFPLEYFSQIIFSLNLSKSIKIKYFENSLESQVSKIKDLILQKSNLKNSNIIIEKENYKENSAFSKDISSLVIMLILEI